MFDINRDKSHREATSSAHLTFKKASSFFEIPMIFLTLTLLGVIILRQVFTFSEPINFYLDILDWVIWLAFLTELTILTSLSKEKVTYLVSHWYDVLIVAVPPFRFLRLFRIFELEETFKLGRSFYMFLLRVFGGENLLVRAIPLFAKAVLNTRQFISAHKFKYVILTLILIVLFLGSLTFTFEAGSPDAKIKSLSDGVWWSIETVTTIGYGDLYPTTLAGRFIAVILMLFGITSFSLLTANIASFLIGEQERKVEKDILKKLDILEEKLNKLSKNIK